MYCNRFFVLFFVLFISVSTFAQNNTASPYSRFGVGEVVASGFSVNKSMGGIGIGLRSNRNMNVINPSSFSVFDTLSFNFEFGVSDKVTRYATSTQNFDRNDANISYLALGFPLGKYFSCGAGLLPYSTTGYNIVEKDGASYMPKEIFFKGAGGINKVYFGTALKLHKNFSLGVTASYFFGSIDQSRLVTFPDTSVICLNLKTQNLVTVNDFGFTYGAQYSHSINDKWMLTLGAIFENKTKLSAKRNLLVTNYYNVGGTSTVDTVKANPEEKGSVSLPMSYGLGFTLRSDKILFGVDFHQQNWADTKFFDQTDSLADSRIFAAGFEYTPNKNSITSFWQRVNYRLGARYSDTYLYFSEKNEQLKDIAFTFGFGLPLRKTKSGISVSFEVGQRGTTNKNLIKENYAIVSLTFSLSDIWFIRPKFD